MAEFEVTSLADSGAGTLREALAFAEANGIGTDTITFHTSLSGGTIFLQSQLTINSGAVNIIGDTDGTNGGFTEDNITISGDSNMSGGVPAAGDTRHMKIAAGATVAMSELILQNGYDNTSALGFAVGSILNQGLLITNNVHFKLNSAFGPNGALTFTDGEPGTGAVIIANSGNMIMQETYFSGNRAGGGDGADGASGLGTGGENGGNGGNGGAVGTIINNGGNISGDFGYDNLITNGTGGAAGAAGPNPGETAGAAGSNGVGSFDLFDTGSGGSNTATTMLDASFGTYGNDTIDAPDAATINPVSIYGFSGNDTLNAGTNTRGDTFYGGVGRDTIRAGFGNDTLFGGADLDVLEGQGDNDTLRGGGGDDLLEGGAGLDMVFGEAGNDLMYLSAGESNAAETYDGGDGTDILQVRGASGNVFLNLATINAVETFQFSGNAGADIVAAFSGTQFGPGGLGNALIDGDGQSGTDNTIQIVLATNSTLDFSGLTFTDWQGVDTGTDIINIFGDGDSEIIVGSSARDQLIGNGGDDRLDGGGGADSLFGNAGNDTYIVDNAGDTVVENGVDASDQVFTTVSYNVPVNVELLTMGGTANINSTGTSARDIIKGNAGNNTINGAGGIDVLEGMDGNDTYAVDNSADAVIETTNGGEDAVYSSVDIMLFGNVETLILTGNAVSGFGDNTNNQIFGNGFTNNLFGAGGTDYLLGLGGNDNFIITPENGAVDVIGDFQANGDADRIGISGFGAGAQVVQVSQTSFQIRSGDMLTTQQFILQGYSGGALVEGPDFFFG